MEFVLGDLFKILGLFTGGILVAIGLAVWYFVKSD